MEARFDSIMTVGGSGGMLPQEIRCSEIASGAIFGQKQSCSNYCSSNIWLFYYILITIMTALFFGQKQSRSNYSSSNIWLSYMHLLSQLTSNFNKKRY